jgi:neutral/alkaline ceramidase-like enzyme
MNKTKQLCVGAAKADITPEYGTQIGGDLGKYRPVEEIRDRLYARIVIVKSDNNIACIIICDIPCITREIGLEFRARIAKLIDARSEDVMIHCSQSHSAPRVGEMFGDSQNILTPDLWWVRGDNPAYNQLFISRILESARKAIANMVPAKIKFARAMDNRCAFNRRFVMRDGSIKTHPKNCDENILYCEGPIDPEASLLVFEDSELKPIAGLLHYTCHPTHGYPYRYISADWPGLWSDAISEKLGANCVVGCINGACGNIAPNDHNNPDYDRPNSLGKMLKCLTQTGEKLINNLKTLDEVPLKIVNSIVKIQRNPLSSELEEKAWQMIKDHPSPIFLDDKKERISWDWIFALRNLDKIQMLKVNPYYSFEIQVFRIGDAVIVGWPGEPFVEGQLEVKLKSQSKYTIVGHECNDECGYLPTEIAASKGGYESWGKLPPGTLEKITKQTIKVIEEIFK